MNTLILMIAMCADAPSGGMPIGMQDYFERADAARANIEKIHTTKISDLEIAIRGERNPSKKANLRRELNRVENSYGDLKRSKVFAYMPKSPAVGTIGVFGVAEVVAVIDDKSVLVIVGDSVDQMQKQVTPVLITGIATKSLKARERIHSTETWRVTDTAVDDEVVLRRLSETDKKHLYSVEAVPKREIEKYRSEYVASK